MSFTVSESMSDENGASVLQCVVVCCSVLQCVAVCCNVLQCVVMYCSVQVYERRGWCECVEV